MKGGVLVFMHSRSLKTIDPRIPTVPRRSTSGLHRPGKRRLHQARGAVRCSASRIEGELRSTESQKSGGFPHLVRTFMLTDGSSGVATFRASNGDTM